MKRRTLLIGAGGLAIGSGVIFGSGAFTQVSADRELTIGVSGDSESLLALVPNSNLESVAEVDGQLVVDSERLSSNKEGFNVDSTVEIGTTSGSGVSSGVDDGDEAFKIVNNFDQAIDIAVEFDGLGDGNDNVLTFHVTTDDGSSTVTESFNTNNKDGFGITGVDPDSEGVPPGAEARVALELETEAGTGPADLSGTITFSASGEPTTGANPPAPTPEIRNTDTNSTFDTLGAALSNVDTDQTIEVTGPGVLSEDVTIDTDGVTLRGINSPSIDGTVTENANNITIEGFDQNSISTLVLQGGTGNNSASITNCTITTLTPDGGEAEVDNSAVENIGTGSGDVSDISVGQNVEVGSGLISVSPGDGSDGGLFTSLSSAVSNANTNATVRVGPDTYSETVTIDAKGLTLEAAEGANPTVTQSSGSVVEVNANDVTVDGLTVEAGDGTFAVNLDGVSDDAAVTLTNNTIDLTAGNDTSVGIVAGSGSGISETIESNTFQANPDNFLGDATTPSFVDDSNDRVDLGTIQSGNTFEPGVVEFDFGALAAAVPVDSNDEFLQALADDRDAGDGTSGGPFALSKSYTDGLDNQSIAGQRAFGSTVRVDIDPADINTSNSYTVPDGEGGTDQAISGVYITGFDQAAFQNVIISGGQVFIFVPDRLSGEQVTIAVGNFDQTSNPSGWRNLSGDDIVIQNVTIESAS